MPSPSVKASIKVFFKDFDLSKVFAIRSKRPTKNRRTQCSSTTHHEDHDSTVSADIPMHSGSLSLARDPGLDVSINDIFSTTASHGNSFARTASDMAQTFLPVVQAVASAIPVAGPAMQAAIGGLLSILQIVDRCSQNKADLDRLTSRLQQLSLYLYNAPIAQDPFEQHRRKAIIGILEETSAQLRRLENCRLEYASVTQAIAGCSIEIDRYLVDYMWSSQMQNRHDIHEVLAILRRQQDPVGPTSMQLTALGCVKLVDATGHEHPISVTFCTSFQQLNDMLQVLFKSESIEARIQRQYMEQGQYDLCIDNDKQVTQLTSHEWPRIEVGTTIVMRVIFEQEQETRPEVEYQCHFCGAVNRIGAEHSLQRQAGCSINCRVCKRRFQISRGKSSKRKTRSFVDHIHGTEAGMHLIRNFHVQQTVRSHSESSMTLSVASQAMLDANQRRRRHDATHRCDECGQTFTAVFSLKRHMQRHSGMRPFVCSVPGCDQAFFNQSDCRRHERSRKRHKGLPFPAHGLDTDSFPSVMYNNDLPFTSSSTLFHEGSESYNHQFSPLHDMSPDDFLQLLDEPQQLQDMYFPIPFMSGPDFFSPSPDTFQVIPPSPPPQTMSHRTTDNTSYTTLSPSPSHESPSSPWSDITTPSS